MKLYVFWMLLVSTLTFICVRDQGLAQGHKQMCGKIQKNFVEKITSVDLKQCEQLYGHAVSFKAWELQTNRWLSTWGWSHLSVYSPSEVDEIWNSKTKSIGIKLKRIEGRVLVYRAHPKSPFKRGDVFLKVNGQVEFSFDDVLYSGGKYEVERRGKKITIQAFIRSYTWKDRIIFKKNILRVPSFRGEFFKEKAFKELKENLKKVKESVLYIDLRQNYGGNIAAGLKFLSLFLCQETRVGIFTIPSRIGLGESDYPISIEQSVQVAHLKKYEKVFLNTPQSDYCFSKEVVVLVNSVTASTAELVTQAFIDNKRGKVIGEQTSGRMVLSSWDTITNFPDGFYVSYPYALYKSVSGAEIEKEGVFPDVFKTYSYALERVGKDSFLY